MDWKTVLKKFLFPPFWLIFLLAAGSTAALVYVFLSGRDESALAYAVYVSAFYALSVLCIFLWKVLPQRLRAFRRRVYDHPLGNRYLTDAAFRTHISLYASLGVNLLYAGVNAFSFALYRSMWFIVLAGYYIILAVMRFLLVRYVRKTGIGTDRRGELRRAILCSVILLSVNFVLSGAVLMILYQNRGFTYHGILIYVMASYTFYITVHASIDLVKYRKFKSPVMMTSKVIALSAALVSMLSLETAMLSQFGQDMDPESKWLMIALTGAGVSLAVITMSGVMIARSANEIKKLRE